MDFKISLIGFLECVRFVSRCFHVEEFDIQPRNFVYIAFRSSKSQIFLHT